MCPLSCIPARRPGIGGLGALTCTVTDLSRNVTPGRDARDERSCQPAPADGSLVVSCGSLASVRHRCGAGGLERALAAIVLPDVGNRPKRPSRRREPPERSR